MSVDNIRNQMHCQNDQRARREDCGRVVVIEAKRWQRHDEGSRRREASVHDSSICTPFIFEGVYSTGSCKVRGLEGVSVCCYS